MSFGPWMLKAFGVLKKFKFLRGTPLDPFGYSAERRMERQLIADYEALLEMIAAELTPHNHAPRWRSPRCRRRSAATARSSSAISTVAKAEEANLREQFRSGASRS